MPLRKAEKNIYKSEQQAIKKTREKFSAEFVEAFNYFADCLCEEFQKRGLKGEQKDENTVI